ncbi:MAG: septal ring lytic transglycosylase RlpA family protein [Hyphomicrobiaceae bacterium]
MRTVIMAAIAALTFGFLSAAPASAAPAKSWSCQKGASACTKTASSRKTYKSNKYAHKHRAHRKHASKRRSASRHAASPRRKSQPSYSYSGGSSGGLASYYWQPQRVASGGWFNPNALTAAHKTLPFGTKVQVTNRHNGKSVVVTINDRGPYIKGRVIDLSSRAAGIIGMKGAGVVPVSMTVLGR